MRIARFARGDGVAYGVVEGADDSTAMIAELYGHPFGVDPGGVRLTGRSYPLVEVRLLAPVLPSKVVGATGPAGDDGEPVLYLKPSTAVTGPGEAIGHPVKLTDSIDCAGVLAIIIGRLCHQVPRERADEVIFGYTCANDITAPDLLARDGQWTRAKGFDTFCPLGPWMETGTSPADLGISTAVNGIPRAVSRTSELGWDVPGLVAYVSQVMTLLPGDVLLAGSVADGGPLTAGDEVSVTIESIGTLANRVVVADLRAYEHMGGAGGQRVAAWAALVLGVGGLVVSAAGLAIQVLPRHFTAAQQQDLAAWQTAGRWRSLQAGRVFPGAVGYQLPDTVVLDDPPLRLRAMRVEIEPQAACAAGVTGAGAAADLRRAGCQAILRAVYEDETRSFVMTVGVAVLPSANAASAVSAELSGSAGVTLTGAHRSASRLARWRLALPFGYSRQFAAVQAAGPYLVLYTAGYADGRPRVQLAHDSYAQAEISSLAEGVASAVVGVLGTPPPPARCPGAPGC